MKYPLLISCPKCKGPQEVFMGFDDQELKTTCAVCGTQINAFVDGLTPGEKLIERSRHEYLKNSDYPLSIVFSAFALECQVSWLYFKWRRLTSDYFEDQPKDDALEDELRRYPSISRKISETARLMYPAGLDTFVSERGTITEIIRGGFTKVDPTNMSDSLRKEVFWPRNRVLHLGYSKHTPKEALLCFNTARLGLFLFRALDEHKRSAA